MDRRKFIAVGVTALLAGCDSEDSDGTDTPTDGGTPGGDGTPSGDDTPQGTAPPSPTEQGSPTPGGTGDFNPDVTWNSCTSFTVDADSYTAVFASLADGSVARFEEGYTGSNTFETEAPINSIEIYSDSGQYTGYNPDAASCREDA